ncbi:MAG: hypothetical protein K2J06_01155, partial [Muribaculaceae bacterium]|nr:hypothetical protein [Muribaculaceae bacterium]
FSLLTPQTSIPYLSGARLCVKETENITALNPWTGFSSIQDSLKSRNSPSAIRNLAIISEF